MPGLIKMRNATDAQILPSVMAASWGVLHHYIILIKLLHEPAVFYTALVRKLIMPIVYHVATWVVFNQLSPANKNWACNHDNTTRIWPRSGTETRGRCQHQRLPMSGYVLLYCSPFVLNIQHYCNTFLSIFLCSHQSHVCLQPNYKSEFVWLRVGFFMWVGHDIAT